MNVLAAIDGPSLFSTFIALAVGSGLGWFLAKKHFAPPKKETNAKAEKKQPTSLPSETSTTAAQDELTIFQAALNPMWVYDPESLKVLASNQSACRIYGYQPHEFADFTLSRLFISGDAELFETCAQRILTKKEQLGLWKNLRRDGSSLDVELCISPISYSEKKAHLLIATDVSERSHTIKALHRSEERFLTLFERVPVMVFVLDFSGLKKNIKALQDAKPNQNFLGEIDDAGIQKLAHAIRFIAANERARTNFTTQEKTTPYDSLLELFSNSARPLFTQILRSISESETSGSGEIDIPQKSGRHIDAALAWSARTENGDSDWTTVFLVMTDVSGLKFAEHERTTSDQRYRLLAENTIDIVSLHNADGRFLFVSPSVFRATGFRSEELIGLDPYTIAVHPEDRERVLSENQLTNSSQKSATIQWRWLRKDGSFVWVATSSNRIPGASGQKETILWTTRDISEQRRVEEALRTSELRYRTLAETSAVGIWQIDAKGGTSYINPAMRTVLELDATEALPENPIDAFFTSESRETIQYHQSKRTRGLSSTYEVEIIGKLGTRRTLLVTGAPLLGSNGELEGMIGTFTDLSDRKIIEESLAAEKERLTVTLRSLADAVITTDTDGNITLINDAGEQLCGQRFLEIYGRPLEKILPLFANSASTQPLKIARTVLEEDRTIDLPPQAIFKLPNTTERMLAGKCAPIHDSVGRVVGTVSVVRDISDQRHLEQELLKASKLESIGVLAGGIAHDFNNILTAVLGNVTLCQMEPGLPPHIEEWLRDAERASQRARDLTQQLLTFAKGGDPIKKAVSLVDILRESAEFARHGSKVLCRYEISSDLWNAEVDAGQISQVIHNLVINAVQAMDGGGSVTIGARNLARAESRTHPVPPGDYVMMTVQDQGPGIATELLEKIFDPYFTTKRTGTGLGLATSYSIAKRHNGLLRVESELGKGATFFLYVPASPALYVETTTSQRITRRFSGRILFMDDEASIRQMALNLLQRLGFEAEAVVDGQCAIDSYVRAKNENRPFEVVIMDLTVPGGLGGRQAAQRILQIDATARIIVSSGYSNDPILANHRAHGFCGVINKPYKVEDFSATLDHVLSSNFSSVAKTTQRTPPETSAHFGAE